MNKKILVVIPARGGSKGIPRKNIRLLGNKPLIYYAISTALQSRYVTDVYVTSDDDEILTISKKFGAKTHKRELSLSDDETTLDPVIYDACVNIEKEEEKIYDLVITMQPTSPLLKSESLDIAIKKILNNKKIDTIISAKDDTHLSWRKEDGIFLPNYQKRVNRQYLTPSYTETGGFLITRRKIVTRESRIGKNVDLHILKTPESIDIDTYTDWNLCEYFLNKRKILFVVRGNKEIGLGHVYNTLAVANDITEHDLCFLIPKDSKLAFEKIKSKNFSVFYQKDKNLIKEIQEHSPDIVVNDILNTDKKYISSLKNLGIKVVNFEDLGNGAKKADLVINAIYPENSENFLPNHYFGHRYFLLRDEFIYSKRKRIQDVKSILVTFGGVDPNNYTYKVISSIYKYCRKKSIKINVITGFGYKRHNTLKEFPGIQVFENVANISEHMLHNDIVFTSAGRTIYELASIATPAIVLAQNKREMTHFFASEENGFLNLGLGYNIDEKEILKEFKRVVKNKDLRIHMNKLMKKKSLKKGRERVKKLILDLTNRR